MRKLQDLVGQKFGRWTVLSYIGCIAKTSQKKSRWLCKCGCGNEKIVAGYVLKDGSSQSCGCLQKESTTNRFRKNIVGQKFGRLTVISFAHNGDNTKKKAYWNCVCDCGNEYVVCGTLLRTGGVQSCGCILSEKMEKTRLKKEKTNSFFWSEQETQYLIEHYNDNYDNIGKYLNKSRNAINTKLGQLRKLGKIGYNRKPVGKKSNNLKNISGMNSKKWKGYKDLGATEFGSMKYNAKKRNIDFIITIQDIWNQYIKQNKLCVYTGLELFWNKGCPSNHSIYTKGTASLDRIDSLQPYIENNIQIIHKDLQWLKNDLNEQRFFDYIKLIINPIQDCVSLDIIEYEKGHRFAGYGNLYRTYVNSVQHHSKDRNLEFDIDIKYLWDLFLKQNGCCVLTGLPLKLQSYTWNGNASLDRIDSNKGYIKGNIRWIFSDINIIKSNLSDNDFIKWCQLIYNYRRL